MMKRYEMISVFTNEDGAHEIYGVIKPDGEWVKYEDAQAQIAELEYEILNLHTRYQEEN